jgi:hypothetical protein
LPLTTDARPVNDAIRDVDVEPVEADVKPCVVEEPFA